MKTQFLAIILLNPLLAVAQPKTKKTTAPTADPDKQTIIADLNKLFPEYAGISKQIWDFAELGYQEEKSSALLEEQLKKKPSLKTQSEASRLGNARDSVR